MSDTVAATIAVALIAALPGILAFLNQRRKDNADITDVSQRAARDMIGILSAENKDLRQQVDDLEAEIKDLKKQLKECNHGN